MLNADRNYKGLEELKYLESLSNIPYKIHIISCKRLKNIVKYIS